MTSFLFWNLGGNQITPIIGNLARHWDVDILMLAECEIDIGQLLITLNERSSGYHYVLPVVYDRVRIFTRLPGDSLSPVDESERMSIRQLILPDVEPILVAVTHAPSKRYMSDASQRQHMVQLSIDIKQAEEKVGHSRTILVGDLNNDPFEEGVAGAAGLHGMMSRRIASRGQRVVQGISFPMFYNPMWRLLGDESSGAPGTYYYDNSNYVNYFWHIFDQVLIRPDLLAHFDDASLAIVQADGQTSFIMENGRPDADHVSDHLPIYFELSL